MAQATSMIVDLEREFWDKANDPSFFERVFADDGITVIEPMGFIDKKKALEMIDPSMSWRDVEMKDTRTIEISPDCTAILYRGKAVKGSGDPYSVTMVSVYAKRDGDWQLVLSVHLPQGSKPKKEG